MWSGGRIGIAVVLLCWSSVASSRLTKDLLEVNRDAGWVTAGDTSTDIVLKSLYLESTNEAERTIASTAGSRNHARQLQSTSKCAGVAYTRKPSDNSSLNVAVQAFVRTYSETGN